jgi:hypothetical protein
LFLMNLRFPGSGWQAGLLSTMGLYPLDHGGKKILTN